MCVSCVSVFLFLMLSPCIPCSHSLAFSLIPYLASPSLVSSPSLICRLSPGSQVLMQKMKNISQQHKELGDEDRSPEELQKVFEKVEIALQASTTPPKHHPESGSHVLKEKDQNSLQAQQAITHSVQSSVAAAAAQNGNESSGGQQSASGRDSGIGHNSESVVSSQIPPPPMMPVPPPPQPQSPPMSRFVIDPDFSYIDFARRGSSSEFATFRIQDYSWDEHGFSLVNQLYNDVGNLLDEKFKKTYHMTYYTMGQKENVDTSMFRRAIWNYIQCIFGIRHDDYDYREVNELLTRDLKTYIKTACCFPSRVRKEDCDRVMPEFWRSEKIHVNLMITEARMQASLLYALRAVMKFMT